MDWSLEAGDQWLGYPDISILEYVYCILCIWIFDKLYNYQDKNGAHHKQKREQITVSKPSKKHRYDLAGLSDTDCPMVKITKLWRMQSAVLKPLLCHTAWLGGLPENTNA